MADRTRLRLLWQLARPGAPVEQSVSELVSALGGVARPAVSQHLAKLRLAGLVSRRRVGRRVLYAAKGGHVRRLVSEVFAAADHHVRGMPDHD